MKQKFIFIPLLVFAISSCGNSAPSSESYVPEPWTDGDGYVDHLPESSNDGTIFHAFCWTFDQIRENLDAIYDAGFKTIQTSPVTDVKGGGLYWWAYYQPVSYSISTRSGLGNKAQLEALCTAAHSKGINIIADVVFNHLATTGNKDSDGLPEVDPEVRDFEPYIYDNQDVTFHHIKTAKGAGQVTQLYDGLPDLNTANPYIQERSLSLLKECIDVGIDGFRFDAAKHIETPTDAEYASDFWPNTLEVAKEYYKEKNPGKELFVYGEILGGPDGGRTLKDYTRYMKVTDDSFFGNCASGLFSVGKAQKLVEARMKDSNPSNLVNWIESHDTWASSKAKGYNNDKIVKSWAYLAAKKGSIPLYLARTDDKFSVATISSYAFEDVRISAINKFRNRFYSANSYENAQNESYYIHERYTEKDAGALILDGGVDGSQRLSFTNLPDGYYFDQISGRQYHIVDKSCFFVFDDPSHTIILTKTANKKDASLSISSRGEGYVDTLNVKITVQDAASASYRIDGGETISFTKTATAKIGSISDLDGTIHTLDIDYSNGTISHHRSFKFNKITLIDGGFNVINLNPEYLTEHNLYVWSWKGKIGHYSKPYTWNEEKQILLINGLEDQDGFLLALFDKDVTPTSMTEWDVAHTRKQTKDLFFSDKYFDAKDF